MELDLDRLLSTRSRDDADAAGADRAIDVRWTAKASTRIDVWASALAWYLWAWELPALCHQWDPGRQCSPQRGSAASDCVAWSENESDGAVNY